MCSVVLVELQDSPTPPHSLLHGGGSTLEHLGTGGGEEEGEGEEEGGQQGGRHGCVVTGKITFITDQCDV